MRAVLSHSVCYNLLQQRKETQDIYELPLLALLHSGPASGEQQGDVRRKKEREVGVFTSLQGY